MWHSDHAIGGSRWRLTAAVPCVRCSNQRRLHPTPEDLPADALEAAANSQAGAEGAGDAQQQADPNLGQLEPPAVKEGQEGAAAAALDTKPIQDSGALLPAAMEAAPGKGLQPAAGKAPPPLGRTLKHSLSGINAALRAKRPEAGTETFRLSGHTGSLLYMAPEVYSGHDYNHKVRAARISRGPPAAGSGGTMEAFLARGYAHMLRQHAACSASRHHTGCRHSPRSMLKSAPPAPPVLRQSASARSCWRDARRLFIWLQLLRYKLNACPSRSHPTSR
jgi:hypothetical protein